MDLNSPHKTGPLSLQTPLLDGEIARLERERPIEYLIPMISFVMVAYSEWWGFVTDSPRRPMLFTAMAAVATAALAGRIALTRRSLASLRRRRDGERAAKPPVPDLRTRSGLVFRDVPADGFDLDHVLVCPQGIFVIETEYAAKPACAPPDPVVRASAASRWMKNFLLAATGRHFPVNGVVACTGCFVGDYQQRGPIRLVEPGQLPAFIGSLPPSLTSEDVHLAAYHLSRYIRTVQRQPA